MSSPAENILLDEVLLSLADQGELKESLRFWESRVYCVVLGRISSLEDDVDLEAVKKDRIGVLRRCSGGGTVLQGQGCLNYALILDKAKNPLLNDLKQSYIYILEKVAKAFGRLNVRITYYPISDLVEVESQCKISGNAQKRGRNFILHHGTVLYDFDIGLMEKYLPIPKLAPEYRNNRGHRQFVKNCCLAVQDIKAAIAQEFSVQSADNAMSFKEITVMAELLSRKSPIVSI